MNGAMRRRTLLVLITLIFSLGACAPALKSNKDELLARAKTLKKIAVLQPEIEIEEISAGGVKEKRDEWSKQGTENVEKALLSEMNGKGVSVKMMKTRKKEDQEIKELRALFKTVFWSIYSHAEMHSQGNMDLFPQRVEHFDYSVGPVKDLLKKEKADGLLIIYGGDEISSRGRKAVQFIKAINPFDSRDLEGVTSLVVGLTDKNGDILWYSYWANAGDYDLRNPDSAKEFVAGVFEQYPGDEK